MASLSTIVDRYSHFKQAACNTNVQELKEFYDETEVCLAHASWNNKAVDYMMPMSEIVAMLENVSHGSLFNPVLLGHKLHFILRNTLIELFHRWHTDELLDDHEATILIRLSSFILSLSNRVSDENVCMFKEWLLSNLITDDLAECVESIASSGKHLNDLRMSCISDMISALALLQRGRHEIQSDPLFEPLLTNISRFLCSASCHLVFECVTTENPTELSIEQARLLSSCLNYVDGYKANLRVQIQRDVRHSLLPIFTSWMITQTSSFQQWHDSIRTLVRSCSWTMHELVGSNEDESNLKQWKTEYCRLLDIYIIMLKSFLGTSSNSCDDIKHTLVHSLYLFTLMSAWIPFIKSCQLTNLLIQYTQSSDENIVLDAYRCLAKIMTDNDIKTLHNADAIVSIFLQYFTNLIDNSSKKRKLSNTLNSLKSFCHHDQVKNELIKQGILPLLRRCVIETKFDTFLIKQPCLQIMLFLAFDEAIRAQLDHDKQLLNTVSSLIQSVHQSTKHAAENLLWQLENGNKMMKINTNVGAAHRYDIMISYSHTDKELCYQIHNQLVRDGYRVWIDREQMYGETTAAMAIAIENSEFVLICMSDAYKQSSYCQLEAHYAFGQQCRLIPLIMTPHYKPDGWLGILVSSKIYVDFPKLKFDLAYAKLKCAIDQYRQVHVQCKQHDETVNQSVKTVAQPRASRTTTVLSPCINEWSELDVIAFLHDAHLEDLLPVFQGMNGAHILHIYSMCQTNAESMFKTLQTEVNVVRPNERLTLLTYMRFLDTMKKYAPLMNPVTIPI